MLGLVFDFDGSIDCLFGCLMCRSTGNLGV